MRIITDSEEFFEREQYIKKFIKSTQTGYVENIGTYELYSDGYCYSGYLWEYLKRIRVVSERFCFDWLNNYAQDKIFILWDIHSKEKVFVDDYWKYPKHSILEICKDEFNSIVDLLPEDIYIYDKSYEWTIALTHEWIDDNRRYCLLCDLMQNSNR